MNQRQKDSKLAYEAIKEPLGKKRKCPNHPKYKGRIRPKNHCPGCWEIYLSDIYMEGVDYDYAI